MSKAPRKKQPKGEYQVGYAKPPAQHQFQNGQARPARKAREDNPDASLQDYLAQELRQPMRIIENGVEMFVPKGQALAKAAIRAALETGDPRRLKGLLPPPRMQEDTEFSETDLVIVQRFFTQWMAQHPSGAAGQPQGEPQGEQAPGKDTPGEAGE